MRNTHIAKCKQIDLWAWCQKQIFSSLTSFLAHFDEVSRCLDGFCSIITLNGIYIHTRIWESAIIHLRDEKFLGSVKLSLFPIHGWCYHLAVLTLFSHLLSHTNLASVSVTLGEIRDRQLTTANLAFLCLILISCFHCCVELFEICRFSCDFSHFLPKDEELFIWKKIMRDKHLFSVCFVFEHYALQHFIETVCDPRPILGSYFVLCEVGRYDREELGIVSVFYEVDNRI